MSTNNLFSELLPIEHAMPFSFKYGPRSSWVLMPKWDFTVTEKTNGRHLSWADPKTGLRVDADVKEYQDTGAVEWVLTFTNTGTKPTPTLTDVQAARTKIPHPFWHGWRGSAQLHRLHGSGSRPDDWLPYTREMGPGTREKWSPIGGKSSCGECPFFTLEWDGGGVVTAIGWTGQWQAEVIWGTVMEIRAGMENIHLSLLPGESIRSPSIMQLWHDGDDIQELHNRFRQTMIRHVFPKVDGEVIVPPIAHLSTAAIEWNSGTEQDLLEYLDAIEGLGFEVFWMDAYYLHTPPGFAAAMGNYRFPVTSIVSEERFPKGMGYIADKVHEAGMEWTMWYGFEMVMPGTYLDVDHPEWLLSPLEGCWTGEGTQCKAFDLGNPEAREFITRYFIETVKEHKLDWLRLDAAPILAPLWHVADTPDRVGIAEIRYVEGLYQFWDDVLEAHPRLKIDLAYNGSARTDLESCKRGIPLWRSDIVSMVQEDTDDFDQGCLWTQAEIAALNRYVPFHLGPAWFELPYWFRSGFSAGVGTMEDCKPEYYPHDALKAAIEEGKRIRKHFFGNLYLHTEITLDPTTWHVVQYHRPDEQDGMVLAFRRHESPHLYFTCDLREIDSESTYEVTLSYDYTAASQVEMSGTQLHRLRLQILECPGSVLVEYRRIRDVS